MGRKVLDNIRKGKRPILGKIAREVGYAKTTSTVPSLITETTSYKEIVEPVLTQMESERQRVLKAMAKKKLSKVQYSQLSKVLDELTKNIQLLSGKRTGNEAIVFNWQK